MERSFISSLTGLCRITNSVLFVLEDFSRAFLFTTAVKVETTDKDVVRYPFL
jgi:hypothetical protein